MNLRAGISERILPIAAALAGVCMTVLSIRLLINAAGLGVFLHQMLGFIGVIFVNSAILTVVAIRIAISKGDDATRGEKAFLLGLSLCMGSSLAIAYSQNL